MKEKGNSIKQLRAVYEERKGLIKARLKEFSSKHKQPEGEMFGELCFCLFTPQSKAEMCDAVVRALKDSGLLFKGGKDSLSARMRGVRFRNNKAGFVVEARGRVPDFRERLKGISSGSGSNRELREWLVKNVKGLGYKEASHFLRNIGLGGELAILDRHVLKNLVRYGAIPEIPKSLTKKRYMEIEARMADFSSRIGIPMEELDLLFWSMQTGKVFK
jgi:N-glycosylase/DNA lyase